MQLDHVVVLAETLDEGSRAVEEMLGVPLEAGGSHALMGTHNRLLSLGEECYLEVIAVDPDAPKPGRTRWFGLDGFSGPPRLGNWVVRAKDLRGQMAEAPMGMGELTQFERGGLEWSMAVPADGMLPFDNVLPALMQWKGARAQSRLTDRGCKMKRVVLRHPEAERLRAEWPALAQMPKVAIEVSAHPSLEAEIVTPRGLVALSSLTETA
ncbi:Glyoxalase-like domain-containing protein [Palleronia salina]|uniref:Glyoxalase-like domain-containing protein n=1 Tax=Palleronia salina TaxID=313368 RepID=A0A1M6FPA6_9RHOB|nr:VOC family protein [Palleronia salina]SHI99439.1 Glyoxalase-like domain-containing protein [Palleronia salina]